MSARIDPANSPEGRDERLQRIYVARLEGDSAYLIEALIDPEFRGFAASGLGKLGDASAVGPLMRLLDVGDPHPRAAAVKALAQLGAREAAARVAELAAHDPELFVRDWAIWALPRLIGRDATQLLVGFLDDPSYRIRRCAAISLARTGDPDVLKVLRRARKNERWSRRGPFRQAERQLRGATRPRRLDGLVDTLRGAAQLIVVCTALGAIAVFLEHSPVIRVAAFAAALMVWILYVWETYYKER